MANPMEQDRVVVAAASFAAAISTAFTAVSGQLLIAAAARVETEEEWAARTLETRRRQARDRRLARERPNRHRDILPYQRFRFELRMWEDEWITSRLRFTREEIYQILPWLRLEQVEWTNGNKPSPEKAFCIFLCRLAWPNKIDEVIDRFGCSHSQISALFNDVADHLFTQFRERLFSMKGA